MSTAHNLKKYLKDIMTKLDFPKEAVISLLKEWDEIEDGNIGAVILNGRDKYANDDSFDPKICINLITDACREADRSRFPAHMLYFLIISDNLKARYEKLGIPEDIYYASLMDLKWKLLECYGTEGIWGTSVGFWLPGNFKPKRFILGRLQFELREFKSSYSGQGFTLTPDSTVINIHIPSSGPITEDVCIDSFKRAHDFFLHRFPSGISVFRVSSWLLYPAHREFLPKNSNILRFMDFFEIIDSKEKEPECRDNMWRIFGKYANAPAHLLPRDTGLRRAYADRIESGLGIGGGEGIFFFDGEKILRGTK